MRHRAQPEPKHAILPSAPGGPRLAALPGLLLGLAVVPLVLLLPGGCAQSGYDLPPGGLAPAEAARLSVVVAQTRAQFPELSATGLPYSLRKVPPEEDAARPEPALQGQGVGVTPGLQMGEKPRVQALLLLDKVHYARGELQLTWPEGRQEVLRIAAYDHRGQPAENFDFSYLLLNAQGQARYLVLVGGTYEADGRWYSAYEGTLVIPAESDGVAGWSQAYKLDFGYRQPEPPEYVGLVEQAAQTLRATAAMVRDLERTRQRLADTAQALRELDAPAQAQKPGTPAARQKLQQEQATLRGESEDQTQALEARLVGYFKTRERIEAAYADFAGSNRFRWLDVPGRRKYHLQWQDTVGQNDRVDAQVQQFGTLAPDRHAVRLARQQAQAVVRQHANANRVPQP